MNRKKFSVEQIVTVLKQGRSGDACCRPDPDRSGSRNRRSIAGRSSMLAWSPTRCGSSGSWRRRTGGCRSWWPS